MLQVSIWCLISRNRCTSSIVHLLLVISGRPSMESKAVNSFRRNCSISVVTGRCIIWPDRCLVSISFEKSHKPSAVFVLIVCFNICFGQACSSAAHSF